MANDNKHLRSNDLNVNELVDDLTHVFGSQRVHVIDENTDFSKLGNPFLENSKKGKGKNGKRISSNKSRD